MNGKGPWGDLGTCSECKKPFGQHPSSTGLSLVPTRRVKTGYLLKKLSKRGKRQTTGYRVIFIEVLNQRNYNKLIWNNIAPNFAHPTGN